MKQHPGQMLLEEFVSRGQRAQAEINRICTDQERRTFGPACEKLDVPRLTRQMDVILDYMLRVFPHWVTLGEIKQGIKHTMGPEYPETSISAQLRHLRKERFGSYVVSKKRRVPGGGTYEYLVYPKDGLI